MTGLGGFRSVLVTTAKATLITIHGIYDYVFPKLEPDQFLFFDDGLYTQYVNRDKFAKNNDKAICITTGFLRPESVAPVIENDSVAAQDRARRGDFSCFMSISEVREMLCDGYFLMLHGHQHLDLRDVDFPASTMMFLRDTTDAINYLRSASLPHPSGYVYPYNHEPPCSLPILRKFRITTTFSSERTDVEDL